MYDPIFIIGTGRSGTTLLFRLLSQHPELAWPCPAMVTGNNGKRGQKPEPEPYAFWTRFYRGFASPCRDLEAFDVPVSLPDQLRAEFDQQCEAMGREQLSTKWTGWSRVRFADAIWPDARYVHIVRDGQAVAWSLMQQSWWRGWQGPSQWRWGPLSTQDQLAWDGSNRSYAVLAGLQWQICVRNCSARGQEVGDRFHEIRYEDLVANPAKTLTALCEWARLRPFAWNGDMRASRNEAWRQQLPPIEQSRLRSAIGQTLAAYGY